MIAESIKKDWNKEAEEDAKRQEEGWIAQTEMMGRAKETARTRAVVSTADAQQRSTEPSPAARA